MIRFKDKIKQEVKYANDPSPILAFNLPQSNGLKCKPTKWRQGKPVTLRCIHLNACFWYYPSMSI